MKKRLTNVNPLKLGIGARPLANCKAEETTEIPNPND